MATKGALMEAAERKRFLDTLREDKEFAALVRQELGLADVPGLPDQVTTLTGDVKQLTATVNQLAEVVEKLAVAVDKIGVRLERQLGQFNTDFGEIKGDLLERISRSTLSSR